MLISYVHIMDEENFGIFQIGMEAYSREIPFRRDTSLRAVEKGNDYELVIVQSFNVVVLSNDPNVDPSRIPGTYEDRKLRCDRIYSMLNIMRGHPLFAQVINYNYYERATPKRLEITYSYVPVETLAFYHNKLSFAEVFSIAYGCFHAIKQLNLRNFMLRDLGLQSIGIDIQKRPFFIGYTFATFASTDEYTTNFYASAETAPEIAKNYSQFFIQANQKSTKDIQYNMRILEQKLEQITPAVDIYSMGYLLFMLITKVDVFSSNPAEMLNQKSYSHKQAEDLIEKHLNSFENIIKYPKDFRKLIINCIKENPYERPNVNTILDILDSLITDIKPKKESLSFINQVDLESIKNYRNELNLFKSYRPPTRLSELNFFIKHGMIEPIYILGKFEKIFYDIDKNIKLFYLITKQSVYNSNIDFHRQAKKHCLDEYNENEY